MSFLLIPVVQHRLVLMDFEDHSHDRKHLSWHDVSSCMLHTVRPIFRSSLLLLTFVTAYLSKEAFKVCSCSTFQLLFLEMALLPRIGLVLLFVRTLLAHDHSPQLNWTSFAKIVNMDLLLKKACVWIIFQELRQCTLLGTVRDSPGASS